MAQVGGIRVVGLEKVLANLDAKIREIPVKSQKGLVKAGLVLRADAQKNIPPHVDFGNLLNSAFLLWREGKTDNPDFKGPKAGQIGGDHAALLTEEKTKFKPIQLEPRIVVGFSAFYALYIHEDGITRTWTGVKFLEKALLANFDLILRLVAGETKQ